MAKKKRNDESSKPVESVDQRVPENAIDDGEFQDLVTEWLNNPPQRSLRSVVTPQPAYIDRTIDDRARFMLRAQKKINKDILKRIIRGGGGIMGEELHSSFAHAVLSHPMFRDCLVSTGGDMIYVPYNDAFTAGGGDIEVPIGVDEPSWWPGRDGSGGGGGAEGGSDPADLVYLPISYEEFIELLQLLFDLPFLKQTDEDKLLVYTLKMRGIKPSGPMARLDKRATAIQRLKRFRATYNTRPDDFADLDPDSNPTAEEFPFHNSDLRFKRVEEKWEPDSKAVVFMELDTSGSMGGEPLAMAKFYFLLNLIWLRTKYNDVAVVYIPHNADAQRVTSEADFFRLDVGGGTMFVPAHELVEFLGKTEFGGDAWNKYCLHATDGYCFDGEQEVTEAIHTLIRGGFNYFGYFEPELGWFGGGRETPGMRAVMNTDPDVRQHCGWAHCSDMEQVPAAMQKIITGDKKTNE